VAAISRMLGGTATRKKHRTVTYILREEEGRCLLRTLPATALLLRPPAPAELEPRDECLVAVAGGARDFYVWHCCSSSHESLAYVQHSSPQRTAFSPPRHSRILDHHLLPLSQTRTFCVCPAWCVVGGSSLMPCACG
jgi:hypothetical protein